MIIKRWNSGTSLFVEEHPKTLAKFVFDNANGESIFDVDSGSKIKPKFLPDSVFDSLYFAGVGFGTSGVTLLSDNVFDALYDTDKVLSYLGSTKRSILGYYWVSGTSLTVTTNSTSAIYPTIAQVFGAAQRYESTAAFINQAPYYSSTVPSFSAPIGTVVHISAGGIYTQTTGPSGNTWSQTSGGTVPGFSFVNGSNYYDTRTRKYYVWNNATGFDGQLTAVTVSGVYIQTNFAPSENSNQAPTQTNSVVEPGDWYVITKVTGLGTLAAPYVVTFASVNNTYETATTTANGIVLLSSRGTYSALAGSSVVTEAVLKTVIDNAAFAAGNHVHGNITNAGAIGTTATLPIITGASGVLTAGSFGTTAGTFAQGNDARLSDARTPTAHTHGNISNGGLIGTTANLPIITGSGGILQAGSFGTTANTFTQGNDSRLSDARTPTSHTHGNISNGGLVTTNSAVVSGQHLVLTTHDTDAVIQSSITLGAATTTFLRNDGTWATPVDTNTTYSAATSTVLGLVELFSDTQQSVAANAVSATASRTYGIQLNAANQAVVNVPWSDTNTTYTATALGGLSMASDAFRMNHPLFIQTATPGTPLTGTVWFDIN
jgi:hypothetical protein